MTTSENGLNFNKDHRTMPFAFGLNRWALALPGGIDTMIHLAWLSPDASVRAVASRWNSLTCPERQRIAVEEVCWEVGIDTAYFVGQIAAAAWELGIDISGLIAATVRMPELLPSIHPLPMTPQREH